MSGELAEIRLLIEREMRGLRDEVHQVALVVAELKSSTAQRADIEPLTATLLTRVTHAEALIEEGKTRVIPMEDRVTRLETGLRVAWGFILALPVLGSIASFFLGK